MDNQNLYCPYHNERLVLRVAKQGKQDGKKFWGCPTFFETGCTYTQPIEKKKRIEKESIWLKYKNDFNNAGYGRKSWLIIKFVLLIPLFILGGAIASVFEVYAAKRK